MQNLIQTFIDLIFPPSKEELILRKIEPENIAEHLPRASQTEFPFIQAIFSYKNPLVKELVWQIKYKKNRHTLKCAAVALNQAIISQNLEDYTLIPIPISKKRRKERGYNQCELIIDEIIKINPKMKKNYNLLIRIKDIEKQTFKNRQERIENSAKIFQVKDFNQEYSKILIIDDVTTTGSTIKESRDALISAGYIDVKALTIAH